ncbi:MAG TPA: L-lactate permease [Jatrophihabitans sp.]|jgi:lactate permease|uniref:L-lactate permease n=1 Tax=Jatrophihabitans sp. TaxID=1932789 RepID=UPI002EF6803F
MYQQVLDPVAGSLGWSALFAALPIIGLFVLLGVVRAKAWVAAAGGLAVALLVAVAAYGMPVDQALLTATQGGAFGLFPLAWTFTTAIWIYTMTVGTGHFDVLRRSFVRVSDDRRIQAIVIAFCFGSLLEALAGQGTPVAITSVMLLAVGFRPVLAASTALVANTVPAAFGPLGLPITTLAKVTGLPADDLGAMAGRQVPILAVVIPLLVVAIVDGRRGVREQWWPALACGLSFGLAQFATANYLSVALADIVAALVSVGVVTLVVRRRSVTVAAPAPVLVGRSGSAVGGPAVGGSEVGGPAGGSGVGGLAGGEVHGANLDANAAASDSRADVLRAYAPYAAIVAIFSLSQWSPITRILDSATTTFNWPGLHLLTSAGKTSSLPIYKLNLLLAPGSLLFLAGLLTMVVLRVRPGVAVRAYGRAVSQLRWAILTVTCLLALSFVMNASGQATTLGHWMAGAGGLFAILSPILGWLGVALTGSDTSSNSLFGALQVSAAGQTGLDPTLLAAANASGGVVGKMISLQNLTISAGAVGLSGQEGNLFRRMFGWSLLLLSGMCLIVGLQATPVLSWMVP